MTENRGQKTDENRREGQPSVAASGQEQAASDNFDMKRQAEGIRNDCCGFVISPMVFCY
jgi:hypothetical protein